MLLVAIAFLAIAPATVRAQVTASIIGTLRDSSGAVIPGGSVTVKSLESGLTRNVETGSDGAYRVTSVPVGRYELTAERSGFKRQVRDGIVLVVGQEAVVNLTLEIGDVEQQVTVTAAAPIVNTTLSPTSGLVGEKEVKDLPLNGRSFDQLLTLTTGTVNYSTNTSYTGNVFSVAGKRPETNRFLVNGVDFIGGNSNGSQITPNGASGQLLGVDAVREFNLVQHTYGAEYGKRAGGQVSIVTSSGTNQLHGDAFEYLRNSVLDARNFFDQASVPPFKRNQFGGALGGPIKRDKVFVFGNYEGFRQRLGVSNVAVVPDALARQGFLPCGSSTGISCGSNAPNTEVQVPNLKAGMLPFANAFWPAANGPNLGGGVALSYNSPPQSIGENFGLVRLDYVASAKDSLSGNYMIDDGTGNIPQPDPIFLQVSPQRSHVLSLQETHIFSANILNVGTLGFGRAIVDQARVPVTPIPSSLAFISGFLPGDITIGGATGAATITEANGTNPAYSARNYFTGADDVHILKGRHSLMMGFWFQRIQHNMSGVSTASSNKVTYATLTTFLQDQPTQYQGTPNATALGYRGVEAAWYFQDEIKLRSNLSLRLGLRDEMTNGWNEATGRCSNYIFDSNGVLLTDPKIGSSCLTENNAKSLWEPRVGLAWDPTGTGIWSVRAGFGIHNDLQDNLSSRLSANAPFNSRVTFSQPLLSFIPLPGGTQPPPACNAQLQAAKQACSIFTPAGIEPNFHTPTIQQWSLTIERGITKDIVLQLGYVGSQSYHLPVSVDVNMAPPQICNNPAGCTSGGVGKATGHVPQGTEYMAPASGLPNPFLAGTSQTWWYVNNSSYHGLNVSLIKRATRGLAFKANYTYSKALDLNSATGTNGGSNEASGVSTLFDLPLSKGPAAFSIRHQFNSNFSYELPFGSGRRWASSSGRLTDMLVGGWQWNGILTAQSGFPFTPLMGSNVSGTGDKNNPDPPDRNPAFSGPIILGSINGWFNPKAYQSPIPGTFGNVGRGSLIGPGLVSLDTSLFKTLKLTEVWNLQFRAEVFNILNHANFGIPNAVVFSGSSISPSAGLITNTATSSRQIQFALKLVF